MKNPDKKRPADERYSIKTIDTPIGPASISVRLLDVIGFDTSQRRMIGVKQFDADILWVRDNDAEVQRLMKDHEAMKNKYHDRLDNYSEHLREQRHGKRR